MNSAWLAQFAEVFDIENHSKIRDHLRGLSLPSVENRSKKMFEVSLQAGEGKIFQSHFCWICTL